jgi:hypothetical protein
MKNKYKINDVGVIAEDTDRRLIFLAEYNSITISSDLLPD